MLSLKSYKLLILLVISTFFALNATYSQEIDATISLDVEQLTSEQIQRVEALKYSLEEYINAQNFSGVTWEGPKIPVSINIKLSGLDPTRDVYGANLFIISKRNILGEGEDRTSVAMKFIDKNWGFEYAKSASLTYDPRRFDVLTTLIDFYMLIIIGLDNDSYGELDGDDCFRKASDIFNIGVNAMAAGWNNTNTRDYGRNTLIGDLTNPRLDRFRKLMFEYYVDGIDMLSQDKETALDNLAKTILKMADAKEKYVEPSNLMDSFFYTKAPEIAELLNGYTRNPKVFKDLMYLDPSNTSLYESARDGKVRR